MSVAAALLGRSLHHPTESSSSHWKSDQNMGPNAMSQHVKTRNSCWGDHQELDLKECWVPDGKQGHYFKGRHCCSSTQFHEWRLGGEKMDEYFLSQEKRQHSTGKGQQPLGYLLSSYRISFLIERLFMSHMKMKRPFM